MNRPPDNRPAVCWSAPPSADRGPWVPIYRAKPRAVIRAVVVCDRGESVKVHYVNERTEAHVEPAGACQWCERGWTPRVVSYLGAFDAAKCRYALVELPAQATVENWDVIRGERGPLRGMEVLLRRAGGGSKGPVSVELRPWKQNGIALPAPFDVRAALLRIWGIHDCGKEVS